MYLHVPCRKGTEPAPTSWMKSPKSGHTTEFQDVFDATAGTSAETWHQMNVSEVLKRLGVDRDAGLSENEIRKRRAKFGPNELLGEEKHFVLITGNTPLAHV